MHTRTSDFWFRLRSLPLILAGLCCVTLTPSLAQQQKPNLSGTWRFNLKSSKLGPHSRRDVDSFKIKHIEPQLEVVHVFDGRSLAFSFVVDGKEHVAANRPTFDGETRAKAYWDGETLVIEKYQDHGRGSQWVSRYNLAQDGNSLTISQHITRSPDGPFDETRIYDKQRP